MEEQNRLLSKITGTISSPAVTSFQGSISNSGNRPMMESKYQKKCKTCRKDVAEDYTSCPYCGNKSFE